MQSEESPPAGVCNGEATRLYLLLVGFVVLLVIFLAGWNRGWVVAKNGYVQVRKVPLGGGWMAIPGEGDYSYVIEVGRYPYDSTFSVGWSSYVAKKITIEPSSDDKRYFRVLFDNGVAVKGTVTGPGDLTSSAEWTLEEWK